MKKKTVTVVTLRPWKIYNARERFGTTPELAAKLQSQGIVEIANQRDKLEAKKEAAQAEAEKRRAAEAAKRLAEQKRLEEAEQKRSRRAARGPKPQPKPEDSE